MILTDEQYDNALAAQVARLVAHGHTHTNAVRITVDGSIALGADEDSVRAAERRYWRDSRMTAADPELFQPTGVRVRIPSHSPHYQNGFTTGRVIRHPITDRFPDRVLIELDGSGWLVPFAEADCTVLPDS